MANLNGTDKRVKLTTPKYKVKSALRMVWLRSRERSAALRRTSYHCETCGVKQSTAKGREVSLEVHHMDGIDWDGLCELVISRMLPDPSRLKPLCKQCHEKEHERKQETTAEA